jgi:hypothetical protein
MQHDDVIDYNRIIKTEGEEIRRVALSRAFRIDPRASGMNRPLSLPDSRWIRRRSL